MTHRNEGAVSVVLIICVLLTIIFAGTTYWMYTESEKYRGERDEARETTGKQESEIIAKNLEIQRLNKELTDKSKQNIILTEDRDSQIRLHETAKRRAEEFKRDIENLQQQHRKQLTSKDKYVEELRTERDDLKNKISNLEAQLRDTIDDLNKKIEKVEESKNAMEKVNKDELNQKNSRIAQLEDRVNQLIRRQARQLENIAPDGEVLHADNEKKLIVINLGSKEHIKPGYHFEIFQIRGGGKYVSKGLIEVKEVQEKISLCYLNILLNVNDPVIPGDHIGSPIYDKYEKKRFYVAGDFKKYQAEDVKKLIIESGGIVVDAIDLYTDFVVLGEKGTEPAKKAAIGFGVIMMNENQLLKYLID